MMQDAASTVVGAALGLVSALALSYLVYGAGFRVNLQRFFLTSSGCW